jgi:hypothetical protein
MTVSPNPVCTPAWPGARSATAAKREDNGGGRQAEVVACVVAEEEAPVSSLLQWIYYLGCASAHSFTAAQVSGKPFSSATESAVRPNSSTCA